ncbi:CLIP-associated protein, partial [Cucurbita argyrosperma subsp. argyrosperma]
MTSNQFVPYSQSFTPPQTDLFHSYTRLTRVLSGEHLLLHVSALVPAVVERLGDAKQPVREAARRLLLECFHVLTDDRFLFHI